MAKEITGFIKFIHSDGKQYHFVTERNQLNNNQMFSWDNWRGCFASDLTHVKSIIKSIKQKAEIIECNISKNDNYGINLFRVP